MARTSGREVEAGTESPLSGCVIPHSFTGNTAVLMADGSTKAISKVRVGDQVSDAVPGVAAGETHTVSRVIVTTTDRNFVDVTVKADRGSSLVGKAGKALVGAAAAAVLVTGAAAPASAAQLPAASGSTVTTTDTHPFYDVTQAAFVPAGQLAVGDQVQTTDGATATITGLRDYHRSAVTYDLTIDGLHTYYVQAGNTPLLVHNCNGEVPLGSTEQGRLAADYRARNGLSPSHNVAVASTKPPMALPT